MTSPHYFIYDGRCGLCVAFRDWLVESTKLGTFETVSFDDPRIENLLPGKTQEQIRESAHVVTPDGRVLSGHSAIRIALAATGPGQWIAPILGMNFLDPVFRFIYTWVSKHRYRLSCRRS